MALKPFPKGVSGNPGGRPKKPLVDRMLEKALTHNDSATAKAIADRLVSMARHGSLAAIKLIAERTEGRPKRNLADAEQKAAEAQLTREQIQVRLRELLAEPEVKEQITAALSTETKVQ